MDHDAKQNFEMVRDLRRAIANNELELFFQPKIDERSGQVTAPRRCCAGTIPSWAW